MIPYLGSAKQSATMAYLKKYETGGDYWQKINLLFNALIVLPLTLFAIVYLEMEQGGAARMTGSTAMTLEIGSIVLSAVLVILGWLAHRRRLRELEGSFRERMDVFLVSILRFYVMLFLSCLLLPPVMYFTHNGFFPVVFIIPFALFSSMRPTWKRIRIGAKLNREEWETLRLKKEIPQGS